MTAYILDTETTDLEHREVIELAYMPLTTTLTKGAEPFQKYYKPTVPISFGAMAVHHIIPEALEDCENFTTKDLPQDLEYLIGHNIDFDWEAIGRPECERIDTLTLARYLWPEVDSHTQSALMYYFSKDRASTRILLREAHSAKADIHFCFVIFRQIVAELKKRNNTDNISIQYVYEISETARIPVKMPFGKHKGELIEDLPKDYVRWLLRQDIDQYLRKALTR